LRIRHLEISQKLSTTGHTPILAAGHSVKESCAGFAGTDDLSRGDLNQMRMLMRYGEATQLTPFDGTPWARELAERSECLV
jgi:hypothetical protein